MPIAARLLCQRAGDTPLRKSLRRTRPRASPPPTAFPAESPVTTSPPKYCPHFQQAAPVPPKFISYGCNCMDGAYGTTSLFAKIRWVQLPNELSLPICARTPVPAKCERTNEHTGTDHSPRTGRSEFANQTPIATPNRPPNETWMSAASRRFAPPGMKAQPFRLAAWPLEKTNPLWRPAKENKGVASRRHSISEEPTPARASKFAKQSHCPHRI